MKKVFPIILLSFFPLTWQPNPMNELAALCGTWKMESRRGAIYEHWNKQSSEELLGKSFKLNGVDTILLEDVRLTSTGNNIFYTPVVTGQSQGKPVQFRLITWNDKQFIFENKEHDFPQRVIYHLLNKDSVHAWIEGTKDGKERRSDFYYKRIK